MKDITKINPKYINRNGRYINLNVPLMFDLTDEEIIMMRRYYKDLTIAPDRVIVRKSVKPEFKVTRDQKYNDGRHYTKKKVRSRYTGKLVIIGGLVVCLFVGGNILKLQDSSTNKTNVIDNSYTTSYTSNFDSDDFEVVYDESENLKKSDERIALIHNICDIYQVNYNVVYSELLKMTEHFSSKDYLSGSLENVSCKGAVVEATSEEELLVYTIRCMKQDPDRFEMDVTNLFVDNGYSSGDNYYEQISRVADVLSLDRCLLYAIVQSECGFDSEVFNIMNNPAGMKNSSGGWWEFSTKEEGFFELGMEVLKYYRMIGATPDDISYEVLSKMRDIHAPLSDGNDYWLVNVVDRLQYAKMNEAKIFGSLEQNNGLSK